MKRFSSVLLSVVLLFSVAGVAAGAEQDVQLEEAQVSVVQVSEVQADDVQEEEKEANFFDNLANALSFFQYGINDTRVYLRDTDRENIGEFCLDYVKSDGTQASVNLGAFYNAESGEIFGTNYDKGVFDSGFAYNAIYDQFYATNDCWQRQFGSTPIYDIMAKLAFDYTTKRIFFEYEGKDWMIQIWKGNYVFDMFVGGEIGVYNKPDGKLGMFYDCATDAEMMPISMKVYSDERTYINREETLTWWSTGFVLADPVDPMSLTMEGTITFPTEEMCSAFVKSTKFVLGVDCTQDGAVATLVW